RIGPPPHGLVVVARLVGASLAYLAVLFAAELVVYIVGLTLVPAPAQGTFALVGLGLAEGAGLAAVLVVWRFVDKQPVRQLGLQPALAAPRWLRGAAAATLM